jgi:mono/diheme cytochrome c family protein
MGGRLTTPRSELSSRQTSHPTETPSAGGAAPILPGHCDGDRTRHLTLQPAFPFTFYSRLSNRDLTALKAFLDSVPAVSLVNTATRSGIFAAARTRAAIASVPECFPGPWQDDATKDQNWNRGAYLVATVGRCGDCHTPRSWMGVRDTERQLAGTSAVPGGKAVPNITPDPETGSADGAKMISRPSKEQQTPISILSVVR